MPLKNFTTGQVPYLENYTPFPEIAEITTVGDMFTYDLAPNTNPTIIEYALGTDNSYVATLNIRNITANVDLEAVITYSKDWFILKTSTDAVFEDAANNTTKITKTFKPSEILNIDIMVNNFVLDLAQLDNQLTSINVAVTNITNTDIARRNVTIQPYNRRVLPNSLRIE
jgi:hypothetical protein